MRYYLFHVTIISGCYHISVGGLVNNLRKGVIDMVTYNDLFTFVIMLCAIITLVYKIPKK
nr:MAG TPA: hypothetical protein [Inoviridae sp.]